MNALLKEILGTKGVRFVHIKNYTTNEGETSNYLVNINFSYSNAKKRDIDFLRTKSGSLNRNAVQEVLNSLLRPSKPHSDGQKDAYEHISGAIKIHIPTGNVMVYAMQLKKDVVVPIEHPKVDSSPMTIEKRKIKKYLRTSKYRNFRLDKIKSVKVNGKLMEIEL